LSARQELIAIKRLFADDRTGLKIIEGLGAGLSAQEIRRSTALAKTDYAFSATADPPYPASRGADMRAKVNKVSSELVLTRTLDAFANELIDASDEEILGVAKNLGMDFRTKTSAAFAGVTYPCPMAAGRFFDLEVPREHQLAANRLPNSAPAQPKKAARRSKRPQSSTPRKPSGGK